MDIYKKECKIIQIVNDYKTKFKNKCNKALIK